MIGLLFGEGFVRLWLCWVCLECLVYCVFVCCFRLFSVWFDCVLV